MNSVSNTGPRNRSSDSGSSSGWFVAAAVGLAASVALFSWHTTQPEQVCVATEQQLVPIYATGPMHHMKGALKGYVERQNCVKWEAKAAEPKKPFKWPAPAY